MKRILLLIPSALIAIVASLLPVSISVGTTVSLSSNTASAVVQNVYCKSGDSGYTTDTQTPTQFCKQFNSLPVDVSKGIYPFKCADGSVKSGTDGATACGGVGVAGASASLGCIKVSIPILAGDTNCIPNDQEGGAIVWYTKHIIKLASGAVGSIILLMLLVAGIQYVTSAGDPARIKSAKNRITNSIIALFLFLMAFAILNFLIPGGILS